MADEDKLDENLIGSLQISKEGTLELGRKVTIPMNDILKVSAGDRVYIYQKNSKTGKLEEMPYPNTCICRLCL